MASPARAAPANRWPRWVHPLQSVRVRITLAATLVTAVAVGTAGWLLVRSVQDTQLGELRDDINANLDQVVARLEDGADPQDALDNGSSVGFGLLQVTDERGRVVATSVVQGGQTLVLTRMSDEPPSGTSVSGEPRPSASTGGTPILPPDGADGSGAVVGPNGVVAGSLERITRTVDTPTGRLTVTAAAPVDQVARSVDALRERLWIGLPAVVALVAAVAWALVGRALRPVDAMRAEVDEISGSTMHRRVPEPATDDEIGRLARTMNAMLSRLDATATRQRQFVSDASHELRSPVAAIRTSLEVARRSPGRANWPAVADTALAEESRLEALLDDLLLLAAQDEYGATAIDPEPVNLTALATAEARRPRRVPVEIVHWPADGKPLEIAAAGDQLAHALSNLVDNAARYATSIVRITLSCHENTVHIIVDDDGFGIPPADRERVFERFTRLDDSRARPQGGSGLGLAVVRAILSRHGGQIRIEDGPLGGARFVAEFPAGPKPSAAPCKPPAGQPLPRPPQGTVEKLTGDAT
jgi:signal transduction histidine kinase